MITEDQGTLSLSGPGALGEGGGETEADEEAADACGSRRRPAGRNVYVEESKICLEKPDKG